MSATSSTKRQHGFTLLEVVVALGILALALMAIFSINTLAINAHVFSKKLTIATLLARSKMIDLEQELYDKPLPADDDEDSGDFSDEGWSSFKWRSKIIVPKTNGLTPEQLFSALFNLPLGDATGEGAGPGGLGMLSTMFGAGSSAAKGSSGSGSNPQGGAASALMGMMGPMAGIAQQQFTQLVQQIQSSVREVHLTVTWKEGNQTESIDLVTHVVSLGVGSDRNGGAMAAGGGGGGGGSVPNAGQQVRMDNGLPVASPRPAPSGIGFVDPSDNMPLIPAEQWAAQRGGSALPGSLMPLGGPAAKGLTTPGMGSIIQKQILQRQGLQ